jgi:hypothetical protein
VDRTRLTDPLAFFMQSRETRLELGIGAAIHLHPAAFVFSCR